MVYWGCIPGKKNYKNQFQPENFLGGKPEMTYFTVEKHYKP